MKARLPLIRIRRVHAARELDRVDLVHALAHAIRVRPLTALFGLLCVAHHGARGLRSLHDLGVVAEMCDHVVVMYAGRVVETAKVLELFARPMHPYTRGLLRSIPPATGARPRRLPTIEGVVPSLFALPPGCRFGNRCPMHAPRCDEEEPALREVAPGRRSRCHFAEEVTP